VTKAEPSSQTERLRRLGAALLKTWGTEAADPAYLNRWAGRLSKSLSRAKLDSLRAEYAARGRDRKLSKQDRAANRDRAAALARCL
jgi:hypothetical protein